MNTNPTQHQPPHQTKPPPMNFDLLSNTPVRCERDLFAMQPPWSEAVVTIGSFRSLHAGHRALIGSMTAWAQEHGAAAVVLSFHPTPHELLRGVRLPWLLNNATRRLLLGSWGIDCYVEPRIDKDFLHISAEDFVEKILIDRLKATRVVIGDDFRFGHKRAGNIELLRHYEQAGRLQVRQISSVLLGEARISTTLVDEVLRTDNFKHLRALLGRPWVLCGRVIGSQGLGKHIGSPTLNVAVPEYLHTPAGVYAGVVELPGEGVFRAAVNIGVRPTVSSSGEKFVEAHLLDHRPVHAGRIAVHLLNRVRSEKTFASRQQLQTQIGHDITAIRNYFTHTDIKDTPVWL
ncbi:MAG: riboflavin biosynthesis protein RibF [Proteobacteria bacterium]|nr:riboflavin biosynthesis protein RibF [Pseudomonadota bacterium]